MMSFLCSYPDSPCVIRRFINKALDKILENDGGSISWHVQIGELLLKGNIHASTALNISTGHLAEMMIQGSSRGITSMWKALKHNTLATDDAVELAQELVDFEEKKYRSFEGIFIRLYTSILV